MSPSTQGEARSRDGRRGTDEDLVSVNFGSDVILQMRPEGALERLIRRGKGPSGAPAMALATAGYFGTFGTELGKILRNNVYRFLTYALVLLSLGLAQGILMGRASVVDGDTLDLQGVRIRLWGIDAVESSQTCLDAGGKPWPCGRRAAFALADFLGQRTMRCERRSTDRYGRVLAVCHVGGVEVNRWLVEQGWALAYVEYGGSLYLEAQRQAQAARRGVWQGSFQPPWEYRKSPGAVPSAGSYSGTGKAGRCDPAYPTVCIPPPPPDLDCKDIPYRRFKVLPPDPHRLDRDGDGIGCER